MEQVDYDPEKITERLERLAYLNKEIRFIFIDEINHTKQE